MPEVLEVFRPPLHEPVVVVALALAVFLIAPLLFERLRLPTTVGFIAAGALLGPTGLGWMARDQTIVLLGTVGLLYLMFIAAIEIDLHDFNRHRVRSGFFGLLGFALPLALGFTLGRLLGYSLAGAILLGAMLSSHTLLAYPAASRLGIAKNQAVMVAVGATIITDLLALLTLAGVAASAKGQLSAWFWMRMAVSVAVFALLVLRGLPVVGRWFFARYGDEGVREYIFVLAAMFAAAVLAHLAGIEPIIGAFLAGLALNPLLPEGQPLTNRLNFFSDAFFTPFFLFSVGMLVDVRVLVSGPRALLVMLGMIATVLPAKFAAAWFTRRRFAYSVPEAMTMFGLSVPQAAATLAIALIGYQVRLFDTAALNATIMVILVTSTVGPWLVERYGRQVALQEQRRPFRPVTEPQRILIPIADRAGTDSLMEMALLLRTPGSKEPLLPVAVVQGQGQQVAGRVAEAEKMLSHAVVHATGAGVRAVPLTRVATDFAKGIVRGIAESRATTLLLEWTGRRDWRGSILNEKLDRLIASTQQLVLVTTLSGTVKTLSRIIVVLPKDADCGPGFGDAIHVVKLMANRLSAEVHFILVGDSADRVRPAIARLRPRVPESYEEVPDWRALEVRLAGRAGADELVTLISERRGMVAWRRELDRMPARLHGVAPNLCVLYPCTVESPDVQEDHALTLLGEAIHAERVVAGLRGNLETAIGEMMKLEFAGDDPRLPEAVSAVAGSLAADARMVAPGVVFACARGEGVVTPLLFVGTSPTGIRVPRADVPVRVVLTVLMPRDHEKATGAYVSELQPLFASPARVEQLAKCTSIDCVSALFRADDRSVLASQAA